MIHSQQQMEQLALEWGFLPFFCNAIEGFSIEELTPDELWFAKDVDGPWEWKGPVIGEWHCAYGKFFAGKAGFISLEWLPDFINWRRSQHPLQAQSEEAQHIYQVLRENESLLSKELKLKIGYSLNRSRKALKPNEALAEVAAGKGSARREKQPSVRKDGPACDALIAQLEAATYICIADFEYLYSKKGEKYGWGVARYCTPEAMYGDGITRCLRTPEQSRNQIIKHLKKIFPEATAAQLEKLI